MLNSNHNRDLTQCYTLNPSLGQETTTTAIPQDRMDDTGSFSEKFSKNMDVVQNVKPPVGCQFKD